MINKDSKIPIYIQLQSIIKKGILNGEYKDGETIPSETQLAEHYGITRTTVRRAINILVNDGLLIQKRGKGTYVNLCPTKCDIWNFGGFTNYVKKRYKTAVSKVIFSGRIVVGKKPYFKLVRARGTHENGKTVYLEIDSSLIPLEVFPDIDKYDFSKLSLYNIMKTKYNQYPRVAEICVFPATDEPLACEYFNCSPSTPLITVNGNVYSKNNVELERVRVIYSPSVNFNMVTEIN